MGRPNKPDVLADAPRLVDKVAREHHEVDKAKHVQTKNLKPIAKGEVRNPYGRKGKSGLGGVSLKTSFKAYIASLDKYAQNDVWEGLYRRCCSGDPAAIKLLVSLNDECPDYIPEVQGEQAPHITIVMPPKTAVQQTKDIAAPDTIAPNA